MDTFVTVGSKRELYTIKRPNKDQVAYCTKDNVFYHLRDKSRSHRVDGWELVGSISTSDLLMLASGRQTVSYSDSSSTNYLEANDFIVGGSHTKITYDNKGLVLSGESAILASADFAQQGFENSVLRGNPVGNPFWGDFKSTALTDHFGTPTIDGQVYAWNIANNRFEISTISGGSSQWITVTNGIHYSSGNVGIGISSPIYALDVVGTGHFSTSVITDIVAANTGNNLTLDAISGNIIIDSNILTLKGTTYINRVGVVESTGLRLVITAGDVSGTTGIYKGGDLHLYAGHGLNGGGLGDIYFGEGVGTLPLKTTETNVIYYDPTDGKISYGPIVGGGSGTVTSVAMTVPTGLSVAGSPITTSGTFAVTFDTGYSIPTNLKQTEWDSAYTHSQSIHQSIINGTGFVKAAGTTLSYDNNIYAAVSGTPINNQVAVFTDAITLEGHSGFTYESTTGILNVATIARDAGSLQHLTLQAGSASGVAGTDAGNLILKAGNAINADINSLGGDVYLSAGNGYTVNSPRTIYMGDSSYIHSNVYITAAGTQSNVGLYFRQKGSGHVLIGNSVGQVITYGTLYTQGTHQVTGNIEFVSSFTEAWALKGSSGNINHDDGYDLLIVGGEPYADTGNGGSVKISGSIAIPGWGGLRGDIYFGDANGGALPTKTSETNVVYYDTTTGKLSYGTVSTSGGNVSNSGTPVDNQIAVWTNATTIEGTTGLVYSSGVLGVSQINATTVDSGDGTAKHLNLYAGDAALTGNSGGNVFIHAGNAINADATSSHGDIYLAPGNPYTSSNTGSIYFGGSSYNVSAIVLRTTGSLGTVALNITPSGNLVLGSLGYNSYLFGANVNIQGAVIITGDVSFDNTDRILKGGSLIDHAGYNLTIKGGYGLGTGNYNGGHLYIGGGDPIGSGVRGNVHIGNGSVGYLQPKTVETNVVYYDTVSGKLSYGVPSGGGGLTAPQILSLISIRF
jgi:hypothetical protein